MPKWLSVVAGGLGILCIITIVTMAGFWEDSLNQQQANSRRLSSVERQFDTWDGSHIKLTQWIKDNMNDPGSYEHVETSYREYGTTVTVTTRFRGRNAFGALVINTVVAKVNKATGRVLDIIDGP